MTCKRSEQCDHADLCRFAKNTDYNLLGGSCFTLKDPQTNEEWLKHCNTEQLAEWLSDKLDYCQIMWYWACDKCTWSKKHESCMNDKEKWVEWLKQPHRD